MIDLFWAIAFLSDGWETVDEQGGIIATANVCFNDVNPSSPLAPHDRGLHRNIQTLAKCCGCKGAGFRQDEVGVIEIRFVRKDGSEVWVS